MILETISGIFVSLVLIGFFLSIRYIESINKWIIVTSKFIYYSGHPLFDDDQIFSHISNIFKEVFKSLVKVIIKTTVFITVILLVISITSILVAVIRGNSIMSIDNSEISSLLFPKYLFHIPFIAGTLIPMFLIPFIPFFKVKKTDEKGSYTPIEKFLHYIFMGNKNIAKSLFSIELWLNRKYLNTNKFSKSIYVSGMARAGTTVLMQYLGELNEFNSLSYRNLPFLFLPKTWMKYSSKKASKEKERFHQDGIKHNLNSFEALEEPFWRNYIGRDYIKESTLNDHILSKEIWKKYDDFRKLVAGNKTYLAKNNNHLLRAESLHKMDDLFGNKIVTIIPFRNPYDQAKSLLKQHLLLSKMQRKDQFTLDYMDFLVHHEFGLHFKTPLLDQDFEFSTLSENDEDISYWLEVWFVFHSQVVKRYSNQRNIYFFNYEHFKVDPKKSLEKLLSKLELPKESIEDINIKQFNPPKIKDFKEIPPKYILLFSELESIAIN